MPRAINEQHLENERLARKYRPLLVLFPEIEDGSEREDHHHPDHGLGSDPPLEQDYHPRDIRLILNNARLPVSGIYKFLRYFGIRRKKPSREQLLDAMSKNKFKYIDLIDERGPKDVDKFWRVYAAIKNKDDNPEYQRKAYARIIKGAGRFKDYISIQYWLPYFFDDWANVHEMDWEMASIIIKVVGLTEEPIACAYNAHAGSFRKPWRDVDKVDDSGNKNAEGKHPVAYIANGSHASYFSDYPSSFNVVEKFLRERLQTAIRLLTISIGKEFTDFVPKFEDEKMVKCFPDVEVIPEPEENGKWSEDWRWLNFIGKWGSPAERFIDKPLPLLIRILLKCFKRPVLEGGPPGPNLRPDSCWRNPFDWVNTECFDAEESRDWLGEISGASTNEL